MHRIYLVKNRRGDSSVYTATIRFQNGNFINNDIKHFTVDEILDSIDVDEIQEYVKKRYERQ